jgi:hypothetical protein
MPSWGVRFIGIAQRKGLTVLTSIGLLLTVACAHGTAGLGTSAQAKNSNQVVLYLDGAERQAETDEQRREILRALEDLRTLAPAALAQRRYADYEDKPEQWTLVQLLQKYFVPRELCSIDEATLYRDAQTPRAREVVEQQIRALREGTCQTRKSNICTRAR